MKKLIIPMVLSATATTALANLPDEINYQPYKIEFDRLAADVEVISQNLAEAEGRLQNAYNRESSIYNSIQNIQDENSRLQSQIDNHLDERDRLIIRSDELTAIVNDLDNRLSRAENRRNRLERRMREENQRLEPIRQRIDKISRNLNRANQEVSNAKNTLKRARDARNRINADVEKIQNNLKNLRADLKAKKEKLTTIEGQISNTAARLKTMRSNLTTAKTERDTEISKQEKLQTQLKKLQAELQALIQELGGPGQARNNPKVIAKRKEIKAKQLEIKTQSGVVNKAKKKVADLKKQVDTISARLANLKKEQAALPGQIAAAKQRVQQTKSALEAKKQQLATAQTDVQNKKAIVEEKVATANQISARLAKAEQRLANESVELDEIIVKLDRVNNRIRNLGEELRVNQNGLNSTLDQLAVIERNLPNLRRSLSNNRRELQRLDTDLVSTQNLIVQLNQDVDALKSEQTMAITARDRKYQEYISRYEYYNEKLAEAKSLGASQTDVAINIATEDSNTYVTARSNELGGMIGEKLAEAEGSYYASVRSEIKGYNDGYNEGYASTPDQTRGAEEGEAAGRQAAKDYANTTLKPQFFNEIFAAKLKTEELKFAEIKNIEATTFELIETQMKRLSDIMLAVEPVTSGEVRQSNDIETSIDSTISTFKTNMAQIFSERSTLGKARNAYESPSNIPYDSYDCTNVYKNVAEFKNACKTEYHRVFKSRYTYEYFENFSAQYNGLYEAKADSVRAANIESVYESQYNALYPIAKADGVADGKAQIYKEAYARAYELGYDAQLPSATQVARVDAGKEVDSYIANNATLTIKGSKIEGSQIRGGAMANVNLSLKNISPKDLKNPVRVRITNLKNAALTAREFIISKAAGAAITDYKGITFKVNPNASSNQTVLVSGEIILPGGKYKAERVETFTAQATTEVNPAITQRYNYDASPRIRSTFRRRILIHNFDAEVSAAVENLRDGYTVEMVAAPGYESYIKMKNTSVRTGRLSTGASKKVQFRYTFDRSAENKEVKVNLNFIYKGQRLKTEVITLRPH